MGATKLRGDESAKKCFEKGKDGPSRRFAGARFVRKRNLL